MIRRNSNRRMTLEQRIARLEKLLKSEARNTKKFESFESDFDEAGARAEASKLAREFAQSTGISLLRDDNHPTVDSPLYGWTNGRDLDKDSDARYVFKYDVKGRDISVYVCPSKKAACVWVSLGDESDCEGAVNPRTGECEWEDDMQECMYPIGTWRRFDLDMIH